MMPVESVEGLRIVPVRDWDGEESIPIQEWGKDHWSTLAYVETICVDHGGVVQNDRMRVDPRRHRKYMGPAQIRARIRGGYPTILADGVTIPRHDDWDCVNDMIAAGLVDLVDEEDLRPGENFGGVEVRVRLTGSGLGLAARLRAHKAGGGSFSDFHGTAKEATDDAR